VGLSVGLTEDGGLWLTWFCVVCDYLYKRAALLPDACSACLSSAAELPCCSSFACIELYASREPPSRRIPSAVTDVLHGFAWDMMAPHGFVHCMVRVPRHDWHDLENELSCVTCLCLCQQCVNQTGADAPTTQEPGRSIVHWTAIMLLQLALVQIA
jgi:hypothetical protein